MQTFAALLAAQGRLDQALAAGWMVRLGKSLDELHAHGLAHGAVSPVALLVEEASPWSRGVLLRASGDVSPRFRSPERGVNGQSSPADDRWAWAMMLFTAVTGELSASLEPPASPGSAGLSSLSEHGIDNPALQGFLTSCFSPKLADRPATTADLWSRMELMIGIGSTLPLLEDDPEGRPEGALVPPPLGTIPTSPGGRGSFGGASLFVVGALAVTALVLGSFSGLRAATESRPAMTPEPEPDASSSVRWTGVPSEQTVPLLVVSADAPELRRPEPVTQCLDAAVGERVRDAATAVCGEHDLLAILAIVRATVKGTAAEKRWEAMGWYDLAAVAAVQGRCCPLTPLPTLDAPERCGAAPALHAVQQIAKRRASREEVLAPTASFGAAARCSLHAGYSEARKLHRATVKPHDEAAFVAFFVGLLRGP